MAERKFRIHKPEEIIKQQQAFRTKLARNTQRGQETISTGEVRPFAGHSPDVLRREYNFVLELDTTSQNLIMDRVVNPIRTIAQQFDLQAIYPGFGDLPPHITVDVGRFTNMTQEDQARVEQEIEQNAYLTMVARILSGIEFSLDTTVFAGRDSFLCAREFNSDTYPIYKARKLIERVYDRYDREIKRTFGENEGFTEPAEYKDIVHCTIARITGEAKSEQLEEFAKQMQTRVGNDVAKNPIHVIVSQVYRGPTEPFMKSGRGPIAKS